MKYRPSILRAVPAVLALACMAAPAQADEREELESLRQSNRSLIQLLVQQGFVTQDKAEQLLRQMEQKSTAPAVPASPANPNPAASQEPAVVRVPYVPEIVRKQIADQVREDVTAQARAERWGDANAVPEWVDRLKFEGDFRFGLQNDSFSTANSSVAFFQSNGQSISNTTEDRSRERMRARLGLNARVSPSVSVGLRLSTGSASDPVSTSQTLGTSSKYSFALDRVFLRYHDEIERPWLTVYAGRMANPWFGTDLIWSENLAFEGFALNLDPAAKSNAAWRPYLTLGAFPIQDIESSSTVRASSKWMYAAQTGLEWMRNNKTRAKLGLAYYDYKNMAGIRNTAASPNAYDKTVPEFRQKGNTLFDINATPAAGSERWALAADFQLLNVTGSVDLNVNDPVHLIFTGDYVENVGYDRDKVQARTGQNTKPQTVGYLARMAVGMPAMLLRHDWQISMTYRYLEADAVPDAYTDSDFHLGGTNNQGYILGLLYGLERNTWLSARWMSSNEITGGRLSINVLQVYLNARF